MSILDLKLKYPPINELVIGVYFSNPLLTLRAEHIGLFWSRVRDEFPKISQQPPLGMMIDVPGELFPLPRFWLAAKDDVTLIQVQRDCFLFNWRKRDQDYPHYDNLKTAFGRHFRDFAQFLSEERIASNVSIGRCELAYINVVRQGEYWSGPEETANVIPSFQPLDVGFDPSSFDFNRVDAYSVGDRVSLQVSLRNGRSTDAKSANLVFELRAMGSAAGKAYVDADQWFDEAHAVIRSAFMTLTRAEVRNRHWVPVGRN